MLKLWAATEVSNCPGKGQRFLCKGNFPLLIWTWLVLLVRKEECGWQRGQLSISSVG